MAHYECRVTEPKVGETYIYVPDCRNIYSACSSSPRRVTIQKISKRPKQLVLPGGVTISYSRLDNLPLYEVTELNLKVMRGVVASSSYIRMLEFIKDYARNNVDCTEELPDADHALFAALKTRCQELDAARKAALGTNERSSTA